MDMYYVRSTIYSAFRHTLLLTVFAVSPCIALAQTILAEGIEASVNGKEITSVSVNIIATQMNSEEKAEVNRSDIVNQLIDLSVLTQAAEANSLHKDPQIVEALKLQYEQTLANAYVGILAQSIEVSNEELRKEYELQVKGIEPTEFNARHILLDTEEEALDIIANLDAGGEFANMAVEYSTDSSSASGGELGWMNLENYMPEFKAVVETMEIGSRSTEPFETKFGWHVVNLIGMRGPPPPEFKDVKSELKGVIVNRKVNMIVSEMRRKSNVLVKDKNTTE